MDSRLLERAIASGLPALLTRGAVTPFQVPRPLSAGDVLVDSRIGDLAASVQRPLGSFHCRTCDIESALMQNGRSALSSASVLIVAGRRSRGEMSDALIGRVRLLCPRVSIFVCGRREDGVHAMIRNFAIAGADEFFVLEAAVDVSHLAACVRRRLLAPLPARILGDAAAALAESEGRTMALWCLRNSYRKRTVADVARRFALDRKTASRRCLRSGAPPITVLLRLGRLYHAVELRHRAALSQDEIARRLGFSNAIALVMFRARARKARLSLGWESGGAVSPWLRLR